MEIYLDNIATTKLDIQVIEAMHPYFDLHYGNASSIHKAGKKSVKAIEQAREIIANKINALPEEIFFTSGGTEANNWALKGLFFANKNKGNHIIISDIEHPSIIEITKWLKTHKAEITYIPIDKNGFVSPEDIKRAIRKETILVSIMHSNNEIGTIQPIAEIGNICNKNGVYFHTDACQTLTKELIDVKKQKLDFVSLNAHKLHGPKGVGALYIRKGCIIEPHLHGGGQENNLRSGTYNTPAIVGFGKAIEIANNNDITNMNELKDFFTAQINQRIKDVKFNSTIGENSLCNLINLGFKGIRGKLLFQELNKRNIIISAGSACSSTKLTPSHVLLAMGMDETSAHEGVRIGLSKFTKKIDLEFVINNIIEIIDDVRKARTI